MKQLVDLKEKVHCVIKKNKELLQENSELRDRCKHLSQENEQMKTSLGKAITSSATVLSQEHERVKSAISDVLTSLNSLERSRDNMQ